MSTLHVTNGDAALALMREAGLSGEILAWRDVLHEGPVPAGLAPSRLREVRARFIADQGWDGYANVVREFATRDAMLAGFRAHREVVLWFEHDLYDQLQLIQVLSFFAECDPSPTVLSGVIVDEYLGTLPPDRFSALFEARRPVSRAARSLGRDAWEAFRSPDPTSLEACLRGDTRALPFLDGAFIRHLEEFPAVRNGLSRTERQILEALAGHPMTLARTFRAATHQREERVYLGDAAFALYLERLGASHHPLVRLENGASLVAPRARREVGNFWEQSACITDRGKAVLSGEEDWVRLAGVNRWLGGVHLEGEEAGWRWDAEAHALVPRAE